MQSTTTRRFLSGPSRPKYCAVLFAGAYTPLLTTLLFELCALAATLQTPLVEPILLRVLFAVASLLFAALTILGCVAFLLILEAYCGEPEPGKKQPE